ATVKAALRGVHGVATVEEEVSLIKVTEHVCRNYEGMMAGMPAPEWLLFRDLPAKEMADWLRQLAAKVCLERVRKAPARHKKRSKPKSKPPFDPDQPHVATARLLAARRQ